MSAFAKPGAGAGGGGSHAGGGHASSKGGGGPSTTATTTSSSSSGGGGGAGGGKRPREEEQHANGSGGGGAGRNNNNNSRPASTHPPHQQQQQAQQQQQPPLGNVRDKAAIIQAEQQQWKKYIPILYDFIWTNHLVWPTLCVRWGEVIDSHPYSQFQRLYFTERGSDNNVLVVAKAEIFKQRVCIPESMAAMGEATSQSRHCTVQKKIPIPDNQEINRMMNSNFRPGLLCAKTDASPLCAWLTENIESAPAQGANVPVFLLTGHAEGVNESNFALATSTQTSGILSGGKDALVLMWSFEDGSTSLSTPNPKEGNMTIRCRQTFQGHTGAVEDVCFRPTSPFEFGTVSDDKMMCLWDSRQGNTPVHRVLNVSKEDVSCLDWSNIDDTHIIVGAGDGNIRLFDVRHVSSAGAKPVHLFKGGHNNPVYRVEWNRHSPEHFASAGEDRYLLCWDMNKIGTAPPPNEPRPGVPPEVILQHGGHRNAIADFQWNPHDDWSITSVSEDADAGGGTMQVWRMNDMIYRPQDEVLEELTRYHQLLDA